MRLENEKSGSSRSSGSDSQKGEPKEPPASKIKLLVVDDDDAILTQMKWGLANDYEVSLAADGKQALATFKKEHPPLVALDLGLPPHPRTEVEGLRVLKEILDEAPKTKVIIVSGNMERSNAIKAVTQGAYDFFSKPIDLDEFKTILKRAFHLYEMEMENERLQRQVGGATIGHIEGQSPQMQQIFTAIRQVAVTDAPVLIMGESGTGKELIAKAVHETSPRSKAPFVAINCGSIPGELLESELFGHEKGAFTGAHQRKKGKIEFAEGGTLFLDEIGEMPLALQVKLLRFLQEFTLVRIGGREEIQTDVRIVAATNIDIEAAVKAGTFRSDLFFRLNVVPLVLPPLRDREGDVALLANIFFQRFVIDYKKPLKGMNQDAMDLLASYAWPGNVRELENKMKRAIIMSTGRVLKDSDFDLPASLKKLEMRSLKSIREEVERAWIIKVLKVNKGNISRSANHLQISRPALYEAIERLGIEK